MILSSEQVHWIFGVALLVVTAVLIFRDIGKIQMRWVDYLVPALLAAFGIEMLFDPLVHGSAVPTNYAAETAQHFAIGLLLIGAALAECIRTWRRCEGFRWRLPLAAAAAVAAVAFWFHAQHDSSAPLILLVTQHRMIAATLAVSSVAALVSFPERRESGQPPALAFLMIILALQLLVYTEGGSLFGTPWTTHMRSGMTDSGSTR